MNCRQAEHHIFAERDGALDAAGQATLAAHVAGCSGCRLKRANLTAAANAWRSSTEAVNPPDPAREWQAVRRRIRGGLGSAAPRVGPFWKFLPWLAVPLGAAGALAIVLFVTSPGPPNAGRAIARASAVEVSATDGSVVFVDDKSGWVVVWEGDAGGKKSDDAAPPRPISI